MEDDDLIPADAPVCPHCEFPTMIPWKTWWECPRCDRAMLPVKTKEAPGTHSNE